MRLKPTVLLVMASVLTVIAVVFAVSRSGTGNAPGSMASDLDRGRVPTRTDQARIMDSGPPSKTARPRPEKGLQDSLEANGQPSLDELIEESQRLKAVVASARSILRIYEGASVAEAGLAAAQTELQVLSLRLGVADPKVVNAQRRLEAAAAQFRELFLEVLRGGVDDDYWAEQRKRFPALEGEGSLDIARDFMLSRVAVLESEVESCDALLGEVSSRIETRRLRARSNEPGP